MVHVRHGPVVDQVIQSDGRAVFLALERLFLEMGANTLLLNDLKVIINDWLGIDSPPLKTFGKAAIHCRRGHGSLDMEQESNMLNRIFVFDNELFGEN